jgi:hypothetical protein
MTATDGFQGAAIGLAAGIAALLLIVWWRQQTERWPLALALCLVLAPVLSWWSGWAFRVDDYYAGCDAVCPGSQGAPLSIYAAASAGGALITGRFLLNAMIYLVVALAWTGLCRALVLWSAALERGRRQWWRLVLLVALAVGPLALSPLLVPPPEASARGDPLRIAINARREAPVYAQLLAAPLLRVGLEDVRPRPDGGTGMRVCFRVYSLFYMPVGHMYLDMAPEGVRSSGGGILSLADGCWD